MAVGAYPDPVIVAAVQNVNVVRDFWDWVFGILGALGGLAGPVALWYAARAQRAATQAKRDVTDERRRQFQLEILRDIAADVDENNILDRAFEKPDVLHRYNFRVELLGAGVLPFWDEMMPLRAEHVVDAMGLVDERQEALSGLVEGTPDYQDAYNEFLHRLRIEVLGRLRNDIDVAIWNRVEAEHGIAHLRSVDPVRRPQD